jgi:two-component system, OmpR family, KDP operon response regulator KdpE
MRILVVEDDPSIRETLGIVLEAYHHQPDLIDRGEAVLEYLSKTWPDVMLLDLTLQGMSGEEVYQSIEAQFGRVPPTVVLSAVQQGELRARHLAGACFLSKPYTIEQLIDIIQQAAASKGAA